MLNLLIGWPVPTSAAFSVKLPLPIRPSLADWMAPVWVTAPLAVSTVLPRVSTLLTTRALLSV